MTGAEITRVVLASEVLKEKPVEGLVATRRERCALSNRNVLRVIFVVAESRGRTGAEVRASAGAGADTDTMIGTGARAREEGFAPKEIVAGSRGGR